ncbi:MAG: response regulator transcription factor [Acidobacteria bacterium]|nr:response regulator transcription factor [Acidobacteriota bacterium]
MSSRILLVEDERDLATTLADLLSAEGYQVAMVHDGPAGLAKAQSDSFDLIILDVMLPGKNGYDVCRELRQRGSDVAILMLTARGQVVDRVVGLKLGADDYLAKPFDPSELVARVEALLRRVHKENLTPVVRFKFGKVEVDFDKAEVLRDGQHVPVTGKELQLLRHLIDHRGRVLSREEILQHVWEYQPNVSTRTVDVHIAWLRQKLEENVQFPKYILTIRGTGYRFTAQPR